MAAIALVPLLGASTAGLTGGALFAAVAFNTALAVAGTVIDQALIFPALFPKDPQEGLRADDFSISQTFEGAPAGYVDGTCRIEGVPILLGTPVEEQVTIGGGKAGPDSTQYRYKRDVVVLFSADALPAGGFITELWINGDKVFRLSPDILFTSNLLSAQASTQVIPNGSSPSSTVYRLTISSPPGGPDLTKLQKGYPVATSGFSAPGNNITPGGSALQDNATVEQVFFDNDGVRRAILVLPVILGSAPGNPFVNATAGPSVTVYQNLPQLIPDVAESIEIYTGAIGQNPDPYIEATLGVGQVPNYQGLICFRFGGFNMTRYGNGLAQFQATVVAISPTNLGEHIGRQMARAGIPSALYSTFGMSGAFVGAVARGPQPANSIVGTALQATNNIASERDGRLIFERRPVLVNWVIPEDQLGAVEFGQPLPRSPFPIEDAGDLQLPRAVSVQHMDPALDFQTGGPRQFAPPPALGDEVKISLRTWAMSRAEAAKLAWSSIWTSQTNRQIIRFTLPPSWGSVQVGHLVSLPVPSGPPIRVLVNARTRGINGIIQLEGSVEAPEVHLFQPAV